jgi:hypothetical protein
VLAAVLLATTVGCSRDRAPEQPAVVPDLPSSVSTFGFTPAPNEVILLGTAPLRVLRPVRLESASLVMAQGGFDLLEARVSLFACDKCRPRPGLKGYPGYAGSACSTGAWPPPDFGPTYPLDGFEVAPGDRPSLVLYLRPRTPGARTSGITLTYRENGKRGTSRIGNERVKLIDDPVPDDCVDSLWFGGTHNSDVDRVRSMTASP